MSGLPATTIFKSVIKNEGVRGLWRGILPPTMVAAPQFAVSFACFDINRRLVRGWFGRDPAAKDELVDVAAAGALVAIPTSFFFAPADRVKCLLQYDGARLEAGKPARYKGGLDCAAKVLRQGGLRSLFSGFGMTLCRVRKCSAVMMLCRVRECCAVGGRGRVGGRGVGKRKGRVKSRFSFLNLNPEEH